jgi:uncharacterized protein YjbJ (UPF0337 family)
VGRNRTKPTHGRTTREEQTVGDKTDETKGRIKEAAGDLTDDKDLKREGQLDRAGAKVKRKVNEGVDKVKDAVDRHTN